MTPRRFEVHGGHEVPQDVLDWAVAYAVRHEAEWGLGDEDVGISYPLCGTRGPVMAHVDNDYVGTTLICGLILEGHGHELFSAGTPPDELPLGLHPGVVYILDPAVEHGTYSITADDRLLFLVDAFEETDTASPAELAARLIAKARKTMELEARRPDPFHGVESLR